METEYEEVCCEQEENDNCEEKFGSTDCSIDDQICELQEKKTRKCSFCGRPLPLNIEVLCCEKCCNEHCNYLAMFCMDRDVCDLNAEIQKRNSFASYFKKRNQNSYKSFEL